ALRETDGSAPTSTRRLPQIERPARPASRLFLAVVLEWRYAFSRCPDRTRPGPGPGHVPIGRFCARFSSRLPGCARLVTLGRALPRDRYCRRGSIPSRSQLRRRAGLALEQDDRDHPRCLPLVALVRRVELHEARPERRALVVGRLAGAPALARPAELDLDAGF